MDKALVSFSISMTELTKLLLPIALSFWQSLKNQTRLRPHLAGIGAALPDAFCMVFPFANI